MESQIKLIENNNQMYKDCNFRISKTFLSVIRLSSVIFLLREKTLIVVHYVNLFRLDTDFFAGAG